MIEQDVLRRFLFTELGVRGEWVKLTQSWQAAKQNQIHDQHALLQLGQALAAVVMLSASIKYKGSMILQAQGNGALRTLVAQSTHQRFIRGLIRSNGEVAEGSLPDMFGQGRLVLTIEPENTEPYQGIVSLEGNNLAEALETYFQQSEQLNTRLWLFADPTQAAGLLLQELPDQKGFVTDWERIEMLAGTVTGQEMLTLNCESMLHRLFHQEQVKLFASEPVSFKCSCSKQRIERTLRILGKAELESILQERGAIEVDCEFCGAHFLFDKVDTSLLMSKDTVINESQTRH
ncbi:MAG: Hsp33 family molecular chaperone HslO [Methylobacter sp.]|nr:MAG: Hsp33 family molecular chaperone HslO [Methylobacter sp.]PPD05681.1 MAG: Hsp33 family molecular chaperone HslO [Methylobacter sp.]PPD19582.1 MAG: Hsp33 family molecular chaperone HslO [Methylobacter sp.]